MRVLIATSGLWPPGGLECHTRDLALELKRQGHTAGVMAAGAGAISEELREFGIGITEWPNRLPWRPDIIHGQVPASTRLSLHAWPTTPAIHTCHGHDARHPGAPLDSQILRYVGVSQLCIERLRSDRVPLERIELVLNSVDTTRFKSRGPLSRRPLRALAFSNYAHGSTHLPAVAEACAKAGLQLDVAGAASGNLVARPELLLGEYDLVFAKARAALEAMAVGAAVILCDFGGVGPMVSSDNFTELRPKNFGFASLTEPLRAEYLVRQIDRYDAADAVRVRDRVRGECRLDLMVAQLTEIYGEAIAEHRTQPRDRPRRRRGIVRDFLHTKLMRVWTSVPGAKRALLKQVPGTEHALAWVRRLLR